MEMKVGLTFACMNLKKLAKMIARKGKSMKKNLHYLRKETRLIGRYTIKSVLGQGGFGITYLGMDELYQRKVAIKEFFPQGIVTRNTEYEDTVTVTYVEEKADYEKGKERFLKEARK